MDWETEYELVKSGRYVPEAGPSRAPPKKPIHNDDADVFNDVPMAPAAQEEGRNTLFQEEEPLGTPLEQLTRHWMNERHAPDILPAQEELLTNLLDHLRRQVGSFIFFVKGSCKTEWILCLIVHFG